MRRISSLRLVGIVVCAVLLASASIFAQQLTGGVAGSAKDEQGGLLPGVTVTVSGEALIGGAQTTTTNTTGGYQIGGLPPGMYLVTYELAGFRTVRRESVRVQVAQNTR